jgi:TPR repeat protein
MLVRRSFRAMKYMIKFASYIVLGFASALAQSPPLAAQSLQQETGKPPRLTASEISQLKIKAEAGAANSQATLGKAYKDGNGVPQNDMLALKWLRKAADQGDASGENDLGGMYRMGEGVTQDKEEAVRWYKKAAKQGNSKAMFNLGVSYYNGDGVSSDPNLAYAWFLLAQEAGNPAANDAVKRSAEDGEHLGVTPDALQQVAAMYEKGADLPQSYADAAKWYRKAADLDDPEARVKLATMLIDGLGVQQDYGLALTLCKAAAKQNYAAGAYCVGYIYRNGLGTPADPKEAAKWYEVVSKGGNQKARMDLAEMYWKGEGVGVDRPESYYFFFLAGQIGAPDAKVRAQALKQEMNQEELKHLEKKLRDLRFDPAKVFAYMQSPSVPEAHSGSGPH